MPKELLTKRPPPKISILFEENRDALACRDILSWYAKSIAKNEPIQDFDTTRVGYWLLYHHQPFIDDFSRPPESHTKHSYRLQSKRPYIKSRLRDLLELGLIEERGTILAEKGVVEKQLYAFTKEGCLWSWLIEARYAANEDRRSVAVNNFFGELSAFVVDFHTSFTDAFIEYVNRCTNEGLFTELDEDYFNYLLQNLFPLTQNYFRFFRFSFLAGLYTNEDMSRILIDIIEKLDEDTQALVLQGIVWAATLPDNGPSGGFFFDGNPPSLVLIPPLAKIKINVLSLRLLQDNKIFLMSFASIGSSSSLQILGIFTFLLNFEGITSIS